MKNFHEKYLVVFLLFFLLSVPSCEESLPDYVEPKKVLVAKITYPLDSSSYAISVFENYSTLDPETGTKPRVYFIGSDAIGIEVRVTNTYDEVISDSAFISGYVKLIDPANDENVVTHTIKKTDLTPIFDVIQIKPNGFVTLKIDCKLRNDEGKYIWLDKPYTEIESIYSPIPLKLKAYVRLYKKLGYVVTPEMNINLIVSGKRNYGP